MQASVPYNSYSFGTINPEIHLPIPVPSQTLFSLIKGNISLYVIAFILPITINFLLYFINMEIYSRNKENGGLVTTTSASFRSSKHSFERKSPSPSSTDNSFSPDLKSSATSSISIPPSPVLSYTFVTTALYALFCLFSSIPITSNNES